jgi:uncharacterized protein YkwD
MLALAALVASLVVLPAVSSTANASTATDMAAQIVKAMNRDRAARGLVAYRTWGALTSLADDRAASLASKNTLSHAAAGGDVGSALTGRGIQWYSFGEAIGESGYPWGSQAASNLYGMWKGSSSHRALMFSSHFNYIGVGVAYRSSNHTTWASVVFSESRDHTGAIATNGSIGASGTTVTFAWTGKDRKLQTHTAGLRSFDVQLRVDGGGWTTVRNDTTSRSLSLSGREHGHWYGFRVQAADQRGNLGAWTAEKRVWVP